MYTIELSLFISSQHFLGMPDSGLPHSSFLHFSMDGPAVNLSFLKLINEQLTKEDDVLPLVVIGTCSLHPVHTAIRKGVESLPFDFDVFVTCLRGSSCLLNSLNMLSVLLEASCQQVVVNRTGVQTNYRSVCCFAEVLLDRVTKA